MRRRDDRARGGWKGPAVSRQARLVVLIVGVATGLLALLARCAYLQVIKAPDLLDLARSQQERTITLDPPRGPILDRHGKELAISLDVDSVFAVPGEIESPAAAAQRLQPLLGLKTSDLRERLGDTDRHFVWLKRKITPQLRARIESLDLDGVGFARESRRFYPKRTLAAHVLGSCGIDNQGLAGLEFAYDGTVRGTPGRILALRDGRGGRVLDRSRVDPAPGMGLVLAVDEVIQHVAERELDAVMAETSADGATVVALRPQTGEVLALASRPTFDPNDFGSAPEGARRNRAVSDYYEPGSTFKVVGAAAALDSGRVHPDEVIWCENGSIVVARHRFDEDRLPFGNLTFTEVLAKSSNVGAIKVARRLKPGDFLDSIRLFGFGRKTGIELPGESPGMVRDLSGWSGLSHASLAIGQEIGVTTVQLASMMGAIANNGVWVRPRLVLGTFAEGDRRGLRPAEPLPGRRVISENTARSLRDMLRSVTTEGTGHAAAVPGYSVAGKTGTAQKIDATGRYSRGRYVSWFAGVVPSGEPALAIVVMVDEPKGSKFHGGDVSAPVFSRIALAALKTLDVPPDRERTLVFDRSLRASSREGGPRRRPAAHRATRSVVTTASAVIPAVQRLGATRRPATRPPALGASALSASVPMPDLTGLSLRRATETLATLGLACANEHAGPRVTRQQPGPGSPIGPGAVCTLVF
jgi:cell division protein FtsI/penicillin-binding protein 2